MSFVGNIKNNFRQVHMPFKDSDRIKLERVKKFLKREREENERSIKRLEAIRRNLEALKNDFELMKRFF